MSVTTACFEPSPTLNAALRMPSAGSAFQVLGSVEFGDGAEIVRRWRAAG